MAATESVSPCGSSPLARGIRGRPGADWPGPRIIPARTGNTLTIIEFDAHITDHPRSHGEYVAVPSCRRSPFGSSPLARGIRAGGGHRPAGHRIIPARTGNTGGAGGHASPPPDHPRSHGEYVGVDGDQEAVVGSSPLARGILAQDVFPELRVRIIPARTGNTAGRRTVQNVGSDHPRSHGEYPPPPRLTPPPPGSSPLARGIPPSSSLVSRVNRIIPARAGNTQTTLYRPRNRPDHPRSRGEYFLAITLKGVFHGSSPLARGIPVEIHLRAVSGRIIPARAGNTWRCAATEWR